MKKKREFFYAVSTNTGDWGGMSNYSGFVRSVSPEEALRKIWKSHGLSNMIYADRSVDIYDGADYRQKMPKFPPVLAKRFKAGDGSRSGYCGNPDCPFC